MRALVQQKRGRFPNINYYNAALGFEELGYEVVLAEEPQLESGEFPEEAVFVAEIPVMLAAFKTLGINYQPLPYLPQELLPFAGRNLWRSTLGVARDCVASGQPLFAKPAEESPRFFKGQILRTYRDLIRTASCGPETPVWCSNLVDFVSEYRAFVCQGEIVGMKHYSGDFRVFVHMPTVEEAVCRHQAPPAGFAVDFGVTGAGETLVVEQNDGFSLGAYDLHPVTYARLLAARWNEIVTMAQPRAPANAGGFAEVGGVSPC